MQMPPMLLMPFSGSEVYWLFHHYDLRKNTGSSVLSEKI